MGSTKRQRAAPIPIRAVARDEASAAVAEVDGEAITLAASSARWAVAVELDGGDEGGTATLHLFRRTAAGWERRATGSLDGLCAVEPLPPVLRLARLALAPAADELDPIDPAGGALALARAA